MAERASGRIVIDADPSAVMAVIADFAGYPDWVDGIDHAEVVEEGPQGRAAQVRFHLDAGVIKDDYVLAYDWTGDEQVSWRLVRGRAQKRQHGSYRLEPHDGGTEVVYELAIETAVPIPGLIRRRAEKRIIDTALRGLKRRVES
jgi:ribosome-associated toxin RatA of RatAB toxin-antitoxin module